MRWRFDEVAREVAYAAARDGGPSGDADAAGRVRRALLSTREAAAFVDGLAAIVARTAEDVAASGPGDFAAASRPLRGALPRPPGPAPAQGRGRPCLGGDPPRAPPGRGLPAPRPETRQAAKRRLAGMRAS